MKRKQNKSETEHRVPYASRHTAVVGERGVSGRGNAEHKAASVVHAQPPGRAHLLCSYIFCGSSRRREGGAKEAREIIARSGFAIAISIRNSSYFETFILRSSFKSSCGEEEGGERERERGYRSVSVTWFAPTTWRCSDCVGREAVCHHSETHYHRSSTTHEKGMDYLEISLRKKDFFGMLSISFASRLCLVMYVCYSRGKIESFVHIERISLASCQLK